jgi:hypothetical protein
MTWHTFFSLSTMQNRHLLASYAVVLLIQFGYVARITWQWHHTKNPRP